MVGVGAVFMGFNVPAISVIQKLPVIQAGFGPGFLLIGSTQYFVIPERRNPFQQIKGIRINTAITQYSTGIALVGQLPAVIRKAMAKSPVFNGRNAVFKGHRSGHVQWLKNMGL